MTGFSRQSYPCSSTVATKSPNWGKTPWTTSCRSKLKTLPKHADIVIVGAGFTGLATAALAKKLSPEKSVLVLEAGQIGNGASGRTGGMVLSETAAGKLPGLGDILKGYRKILRDLNVNADLALPGAWEIARGSHSMDGKKIKPLKHSAIDWSDSGRVRIVKKVPGGTVDPAKVVEGLARAAVRAGAIIAENAEVTRIEPNAPIRLHLKSRRKTRIVTADRVLLATNAGGLFLSPQISRHRPEPKLTFALATAPLTKAQLASLGMASGKPFYTVDIPYLWGRMLGSRRMIFGSGLVPAFDESVAKRHAKKLWHGLESESISRGPSLQRLNALEQRVRALHPALKNVRITHRWGGPILITKDFVPIFRAHPNNRNLFFLGAFSGHGVAQSVYLAKWAAEYLCTNRKLPNWI